MSTLYVWGNHHCSNITGFRDKLYQLVAQHTEFNWVAFHDDVRLSLQDVENIPLLWKDSHSTLILIFGDSNLDNEHPVEQTIEIFTRLHEVLSTLPNFTVLTCGPIPPWDPNPQLFDKFKTLDSELLRLNHKHPERYLSFLHTFRPSDYMFENHLSKQGSTLFARTILRALNNIERVKNFNRLQTQNGSHNLDSQLSKLTLGVPDPN